MNALRMIVVAIVTGLALLALAGNVRAVDFSTKQLARLEAGKSVKKPLAEAGANGVYGGAGFALIDAPPEVVWNAIQDWGSYDEIYPKTIEARAVQRRGEQTLVRMKLGHELLSVTYYVEVDTDRSRWQISYRLVDSKPHDLDEVRGYWRLFPQQDGRTLVAYIALVKVPIGVVSLIPEQLEKKINRNLLASPQYLREWLHGPAGARYLAASR